MKICIPPLAIEYWLTDCSCTQETVCIFVWPDGRQGESRIDYLWVSKSLYKSRSNSRYAISETFWQKHPDHNSYTDKTFLTGGVVYPYSWINKSKIISRYHIRWSMFMFLERMFLVKNLKLITNYYTVYILSSPYSKLVQLDATCIVIAYYREPLGSIKTLTYRRIQYKLRNAVDNLISYLLMNLIYFLSFT